jgi:transcription antitermination protein NusB
MSRRDGHKARSAARLGAVQTLVQMELGGHGVDEAVRDYLDHTSGAEIDGVTYAEADARMFDSIVRGAVEHQVAVDGALDRCLPEEWPLHRLDSVLRSILRCAAFEILYRADVPARVVMNEYIDVARAFFEGVETGMANGVMDRLARSARPAEFDRKPAEDGAA